MTIFKDKWNNQIDTSLSPQKSFSFGKDLRLLKASEFSAVFDDAPIRASDQNLLFLARQNGLHHPRLGLVIAKKHLRHANRRNRLKRVIRDSFRLQQHNLPAIDVIVLARKGVASVPDDELGKVCNRLWKRILQRARKTEKIPQHES